MTQLAVTNLTLDTRRKVANSLSNNEGYKLDIIYVDERHEEHTETLYLPLKESVYLRSWLEADRPFGRTNSKILGRLKAVNLARILCSLDLDWFNFENDYEAYLFFNQHIEDKWLHLLMGNNHDEVALKFEINPDINVYGGYLGGESESKDKTRFKTFLLKNLNNLSLIPLLLPQQIKNERGKRIQNKFELNIKVFKIL
jgi:hypothetical protein